MKHADHAFDVDEAVGRTVLRCVHAKGRIDGVLLTMTLRQAYRNDSQVDIEAVYTFPLAWAATLLDLVVEIGGKRLSGQITEKAQAQAGYEEAIEKGDAAVMVERAGRDLYTVNVGNLKPGEEAVVELRYAQMLPHDHDSLRLTVPTALAPRYGDAVNAGKLQPHQVPQTDLLVSQDFALELELAGAAARGTIRSPSHPLQFARHDGDARVSISGPALLDRDFVLIVEGLPQASFAYIGEDPMRPGQYVVAGSFCPKTADLDRSRPVHPDPEVRALLDQLSDEELKTLLRLASGAGRTVVKLQENDLRLEWDRRQQRQPSTGLSLKVLVDCSGSMAGQSIGQARAALSVLLDQLDARDRVSYSRFGSHIEHAVPELAACGRRHISNLRRAFQATEADLGGTELGLALKETVGLRQHGERLGLEDDDADILLITDGEVWDVEGIIASLRHSQHRVHNIGVGSAPAQSLLQELAGATGGGCRMVHPGEDMRAAITGLMQGIRRGVRVNPYFVVDHGWHEGRPMRLQPGQTLVRWGHNWGTPEHAPALVVEPYVEGVIDKRGGYVEPGVGMHAPEVTPVPGDTLARLWAHQMMLQVQDQAQARRIALDYRLMSEQTNLLLVHERADGEQASGMPVVAQVPHMLAAGWGGLTRITQIDAQRVSPAGSNGLQLNVDPYLAVPSVWRTNRAFDKAAGAVHEDMSDFEIPAFLRKEAESPKKATRKRRGPEQPGWLGLLIEFNKAAVKQAQFEDALDEMLRCYSDEFSEDIWSKLFLNHDYSRQETWALVLRYWSGELADQIQLNDIATRLIDGILNRLGEDERTFMLNLADTQFAAGAFVPR